MMEKSSQIASYSLSAGGASYWMYSFLHSFTTEEWAAIGVIGNLLFGALTFSVWLYFKLRSLRKARRRIIRK